MKWPCRRRDKSKDDDDCVESLRGSDPEDYLLRLKKARCWYSRKSKKCKTWYIRMQVLAVLFAGALPAITTYASRQNSNGRWWVAGTLLGLLVGLLASVESVIHLREQWRNYRNTEQYLERESIHYVMGAGVYRKVESPESTWRLVERCEAAIASENSATLNVMTTPVQSGPTNGNR